MLPYTGDCYKLCLRAQSLQDSHETAGLYCSVTFSSYEAQQSCTGHAMGEGESTNTLMKRGSASLKLRRSGDETRGLPTCCGGGGLVPAMLSGSNCPSLFTTASFLPPWLWKGQRGGGGRGRGGGGGREGGVDSRG